MAAEEIGSVLTPDLWVPLRPAVDLVSLVETEEFVVDVKTALLIDRLLILLLVAFCHDSSATVTGLGRQLFQTI
jgi:hypothetical protein